MTATVQRSSSPRRGCLLYTSPAYAVVPARGDGAALEQTVRALLWLRAGELRRYTVVIADDGLDLSLIHICALIGYLVGVFSIV